MDGGRSASGAAAAIAAAATGGCSSSGSSGTARARRAARPARLRGQDERAQRARAVRAVSSSSAATTGSSGGMGTGGGTGTGGGDGHLPRRLDCSRRLFTIEDPALLRGGRCTWRTRGSPARRLVVGHARRPAHHQLRRRARRAPWSWRAGQLPAGPMGSLTATTTHVDAALPQLTVHDAGGVPEPAQAIDLPFFGLDRDRVDGDSTSNGRSSRCSPGTAVGPMYTANGTYAMAGPRHRRRPRAGCSTPGCRRPAT